MSKDNTNIDIDLDKFREDIEYFDGHTDSYFYGIESQKFSNSQGKAIRGINGCLNSYNNYIENIKRLYLSTSNYFSTVLANMEQVEKDNDMAAKRNKQGR